MRWGSEDNHFELRSSDPGLIALASEVFRPWRRRGRPARSRVVFRVGPSAGDGATAPRGWRIRSSASARASVAPSLERAVASVEFLAVQSVYERPCTRRFYLHAALLANGGTGVLLVGPPMAGKSTLACALWESGWSLLSDDGALLDAGGVAAPVPRRVSLRSSGRGLVDPATLERILASPSCCATEKGWLFHPHEIDRRPRPRGARVEAVFFLGRSGATAGEAAVRPVPAAHAALAFLSYGNLIHHHGLQDAIGRSAAFAGSVPAFDLGRGPVQAMAACVERLAAPTSAPALRVDHA